MFRHTYGSTLIASTKQKNTEPSLEIYLSVFYQGPRYDEETNKAAYSAYHALTKTWIHLYFDNMLGLIEVITYLSIFSF